jgi:hypothetical protein
MIDSSAAGWLGADFRKSSFSGGENGSCVELAWRKATFSTDGGGCVEVARAEKVFGIRDSKSVTGPVLTLGESQGRAFLAAVKRFS